MLIKINKTEEGQLVSMRDLYNFLEPKTKFKDWSKRMLDYGFTEGSDFRSFLSESTGGRPSKQYSLSMDCAKEIAMIQKTEKGKQARQYFIEAEKQLRSNPFEDPVVAARMFIESSEKNKLLEKELKNSAPKVIYHDEVLSSGSTFPITLIAKELGYSAQRLNSMLNDLKVQYKSSGAWVLYSKYQGREFTKTTTYSFTDANGNNKTSIQTVWTEKGRRFIHELLNPEVGNVG